MKYGTVVSQDGWDKLMNKARERATLFGIKSKVVGFKLTPRAARYNGSDYGYVLLHVDTLNFTPRCGQKGPYGKVCVLPKKGHSYHHISRTDAKEIFCVWTFLTYNKTPTKIPSERYQYNTYTRNQLTKEGYEIDV